MLSDMKYTRMSFINSVLATIASIVATIVAITALIGGDEIKRKCFGILYQTVLD